MNIHEYLKSRNYNNCSREDIDEEIHDTLYDFFYDRAIDIWCDEHDVDNDEYFMSYLGLH
jgi:hypothetical protein